MKKNLTLVIIISLIVITGFSLSRYFYLQKANFELQSILKENKVKMDELVTQLISQKELNQQLAKEKESLSQDLKILSDQFKKAETELSSTKDTLSAIQTKINLLKKENIYLAQLKASFDEKMEQARFEKESLEAKFNSVDELKKAIRDLKIRMREERRALKKNNVISEEINGNRGYLTWRGQSTLKSKVKIEVIPAY